MTTNGNVLFGDFFNFVFRVHEDAFGLPGFGLRIVHRRHRIGRTCGVQMQPDRFHRGAGRFRACGGIGVKLL